MSLHIVSALEKNTQNLEIVYKLINRNAKLVIDCVTLSKLGTMVGHKKGDEFIVDHLSLTLNTRLDFYESLKKNF